MFQAHPHHVCQARGPYRGRSVCRNPRCSVACYKAWGRKEVVILTRHLDALPLSVKVFIGTLTVQSDLSQAEHAAARTAFTAGIRKAYGPSVKLRAVTEVGEDGRAHHHYVMACDSVIVSHDAVKLIWSKACRGLPTRVQHEPPVDAVAWVKYMHACCRKFVRLPVKGGLRITWGSREFFPAGQRERLWAGYVAEVAASKHTQTHDVNTVTSSHKSVPRPAQPPTLCPNRSWPRTAFALGHHQVADLQLDEGDDAIPDGGWHGLRPRPPPYDAMRPRRSAVAFRGGGRGSRRAAGRGGLVGPPRALNDRPKRDPRPPKLR